MKNQRSIELLVVIDAIDLQETNGVTLIKGKDSYYCIDCYMFLKNRGLQ